MSEIKVGEYVKNKNGIIRKIVEIYNGKLYVDKLYYDKENEYFYEQYEFMIDDEIIKHSPNIIDLIEVGDIVRVLDNGYNRKIDLRDEDILQSFKEDLVLENWKLKSIVTKEQFKEMEYRVDE